MIKNSLSAVKGRILTHEIRAKTDDISEYKNYVSFRDIFQVSRGELKKALDKARQNWLKFRSLQQEGYKTEKLLLGEKEKREEGVLKIGVLGYVYNLYDRFINMDFMERLEEMGAKIVTFEMLDEEIIDDLSEICGNPCFGSLQTN